MGGSIPSVHSDLAESGLREWPHKSVTRKGNWWGKMQTKSITELTSEYNALAIGAGKPERKGFRTKADAVKAIKALTPKKESGKKKEVEFTSKVSEAFNSRPGTKQDIVLNAMCAKGGATIADIAKLTGTSRGAVSNVINGIEDKIAGKRLNGVAKPPYEIIKERKDGAVYFAIQSAA
jgi:hypothetical protein